MRAANTVTYKSEVYYRIRDEDVNTTNSKTTYYINVFGNKLIKVNKNNNKNNNKNIKELHPYNSDGYINIKIQGKCKKLHILSAKTFINPLIWKQLSKPTIDHIDGDRTNNHWSNLRFLERIDNIALHPCNNKRNKKAFLEEDPDDIYFETINEHKLSHTYRYNIENRKLYIKFINNKRKQPIITYREVNGETRYTFTDTITKKPFTIMRQQFHDMMTSMNDV